MSILILNTFTLLKNESQLTNFITNDLKAHNSDRARPYVFCFNRLSKLSGRYIRGVTPCEKEKCKKDTIPFDGEKYVGNALDFCLQLEREQRKHKKKIAECILQLHARNGSGFDTWKILNIIPCCKHIVDLNKKMKKL